MLSSGSFLRSLGILLKIRPIFPILKIIDFNARCRSNDFHKISLIASTILWNITTVTKNTNMSFFYCTHLTNLSEYGSNIFIVALFDSTIDYLFSWRNNLWNVGWGFASCYLDEYYWVDTSIDSCWEKFLSSISID